MSDNSSIGEPNSWLEWILTRENAEEINRSSKQDLFEAFDTSKTEDEMKSALIRNPELVFMFKQNFGTNKINVFHHLSIVGGNFFNKQEHVGMIQGVDENVTCVVTPDMPQLLGTSTNNTSVPSADKIMTIESVNDYRNLKTSTKMKFPARNFIVIPPFMIYKLNEAILQHDGDSTQVLLAAVKVIKEFDEHVPQNMNEITLEKANDTCMDIVFWLYLASKGKIKSIPTVGCSNREVRKHFDTIELQIKKNELEKRNSDQASMLDLSSSIQRPLEIIATSSSSTQDFLSKLTQLQSSAQDKSSHSFGKLSERTQKMLLIAASKGNVIPSELSDEAMAFFALSNFSKAQQFLESHLESKGIECSIPTALANLWLQGCFLWLNPLTPSGLAASVIASKDIIFNDSLHEGILLDFSTKHEINKASLSKLTKTQVIYPSSIELTIERIEALLAFTELFFTEKSYLSQGLNDFLTMCKTNKSILRTKLHLDKMFIPKLLFSIDDRVNKWLIECGRVQSVEQTSLELVDFMAIMTDLKLNRYYCDLPENIKHIVKDTTADQPVHQDKKRKSNDNSPTATIVSNDETNKDWKLQENESWHNWRHKTGKGPTLSCGAKPCLKFQVRGSCFSDCANRATHKKLKGNDHRLTDEFIKKTRKDLGKE